MLYVPNMISISDGWMKYEYGELVKWYWLENQNTLSKTHPIAILSATNAT